MWIARETNVCWGENACLNACMHWCTRATDKKKKKKEEKDELEEKSNRIAREGEGGVKYACTCFTVHHALCHPRYFTALRTVLCIRETRLPRDLWRDFNGNRETRLGAGRLRGICTNQTKKKRVRFSLKIFDPCLVAKTPFQNRFLFSWVL